MQHPSVCVPQSQSTSMVSPPRSRGDGVGLGREKAASENLSLEKKNVLNLKIKKIQLQLNSFFGYNHRVRESYGMQLKEGNSWKYKKMEKPPH